jgi:hypothetical protein
VLYSKLLGYENIPNPAGLCSSELLRHDTASGPNGPPLTESSAGYFAGLGIPYLERRKAVRAGFADPSQLDCAGIADAPDNSGLRLICKVSFRSGFGSKNHEAGSGLYKTGVQQNDFPAFCGKFS